MPDDNILFSYLGIFGQSYSM